MKTVRGSTHRSSAAAAALAAALLLTGVKTAWGQPRLAWSERNPSITMAPGESTTRAFTFTSSADLGDVIVSVVPQIARFVTFNSGTMLTDVRAGQPQEIRVTFSVPGDTPPGRYLGAIHLRAGKTTIPPPLRIALEVKLGSYQYIVSTNATDPLLLRVNSAKGEVIQYYGDKDLGGLATALTGFSVTGPDGGTATYDLDVLGRLSRVSAPNDVVLEFTWTSATTAVVSAVSPEGEAQVNVAVDLSAKLTEEQTLATPSRAKAQAACNPATIEVRQCGRPASDAVAYFLVNNAQRPASRIGDGIYQACIPAPDPNAGSNVQRKCESVVDFLDNSCTAVAALQASCPAIAFAIARLGLALPAVKILIACEAITAGSAAACSVISSPIEGAPSPLTALCGGLASLADTAANGPVLLQPVATISGAGTVRGNPVTRPAQGPFGTFTLTAPGEISIVSFTTSPTDPAPGQGYTATAEIGCAPSGTAVQITIVGTDGYQDSTSCVIQGNGNCSLFVPGAEQGVLDIITVEADELERAISIVF